MLDRDLNAAINILKNGLEKLRSSIDNTVGSTGSASGEVSEETRGRRNDTKRTGSPTTIVTRPLRYGYSDSQSSNGSPTTIVARPRRISSPIQGQDYRSFPMAPTIINCDTNKREATNFWKTFCDINQGLFFHSPLVSIRDWFRNRKLISSLWKIIFVSIPPIFFSYYKSKGGM